MTRTVARNPDVTLVNVRFSFCLDEPVWISPFRFEALPGPRIHLVRTGEIFTDLVYRLVCSNVIAYLTNGPVWQALALPD